MQNLFNGKVMTTIRDYLDGKFSQMPRLSYSQSKISVQAWVKELQYRITDLLNLDTINPLTIISSNESEIHDVRIVHFVFLTLRKIEIKGVLLEPINRNTDVFVLVCPGWNAKLNQVTGLEPADFPDRNVADRLTREYGISTLTLQYGIAETTTNQPGEINSIVSALQILGENPMTLLVEQTLQALAWIKTQSFVSNKNIGIFGHSVGGHIAAYAALLNSFPLKVALASCCGTYNGFYNEFYSANGIQSIPGILKFADFPDIISALVPSQLYIQHGKNDAILPLSDAEKTCEAVLKVYSGYNVRDKLTIDFIDYGHGSDANGIASFFNKESVEEYREETVPAAKVYFNKGARTEICERINRSLVEGSLTLGKNGLRLEELASQWLGGGEVVTVNSGTAALEIALRVINVKRKKVIVPANTFFATASAVLHAGGEVLFADIELVGLGIDPVHLRKVLDEIPDVAAIILVHIGGLISPYIDEILEICKSRDVPVIEDAAHALGSYYGGKSAGSFGRMAAISLYPTKVLTSGEGGLLVCNKSEDAHEARLFRDQGKRSFYENVHDRLGNNWRMSEVHAAIGSVQFEYLQEALTERREIAGYYEKLMAGIPGITLLPVPEMVSSNFYKLIALVSSKVNTKSLKKELKNMFNVHLSGEVYDVPCFSQPYFQNSFDANNFPNATWFCQKHICLPLFNTMTSAQVSYVSNALAYKANEIINNEKERTMTP